MEKDETVEIQEPVAAETALDADEHDLYVESGTNQDRVDMHRLGQRQQLSRNFRSLSILGLTTLVMAAWQAIIATSSFSLINGGRAGTIWVYIASWASCTCVVASLAEMASMAPTSGGQYHWVSEFAPPSIQKGLSYVSGWLSALGWQGFIAVGCFQTAQLTLTLASLKNPSYIPTSWQGTLFTIGVAVFACLFNSYGVKKLPFIEGLLLLFHVISFFAILIPLWVLAPMAPSREVWLEFRNFGGWNSIGSACVIGSLSAGGTLIGADAAAHMSEEVKDASKTVPRMMMATITLNGTMAFVMILTYVYVIQDLETQIVQSTDYFPFIRVWQVATGSEDAAVGMTVPIIVLSIVVALNGMATASRQAWSFARDEGLPFHRWFTKVHIINSTPTPVNAMLASMIIAFALALISLGGTEAYNSISGLVSGAVTLTYAISIGCVLWRRLFGEPLPRARWSLGRWGVILNAYAVLYQLLTFIIGFFPLFANVTAATMNWGCAMFGGVAVLCIINYFVNGRKSYRGPVVHIKREQD